MVNSSKEHWESVYNKRSDHEVSWYEEIPTTSLQLINSINPLKNDRIIDVGGGNSNLVLELNKQNFSKLTVLDISKSALERTKIKAGKNADEIDWIVTDILELKPEHKYNVWHDRAAFHFLTDAKDIQKYIQIVSESIVASGYLILGTFSRSGPLKCSGLEISQYSSEELEAQFKVNFDLMRSFQEMHSTPFGTEQSFTYAVFKRKID